MAVSELRAYRFEPPPGVDLSPEARERARAARDAREAEQVEAASAEYAQWYHARTGEVYHEPSEIFRTAPAAVTQMARRMCDDLEAGALGYYIAGTPGSGKTATAEHVLTCWTLDGWTGAKATEKQFVDAMRACATGDADRAGEFARYVEPGLLVLDDVGVAKPSEWMLAELTDLVNARLERSYRTVVTSNLTPEALRDRWAQADAVAADRLASRLRTFARITLRAEDHRGPARVRPVEEMMS